jgi:hypothetical protein
LETSARTNGVGHLLPFVPCARWSEKDRLLDFLSFRRFARPEHFQVSITAISNGTPRRMARLHLRPSCRWQIGLFECVEGNMCRRYDILIARDAYRALFKAGRLPNSNFPPRYNVAPTDQIPIVRIDPRDDEREVVFARWGLIPFWMKAKPKVPHINARAETVHKLPLFREAFAKRRCLIPASGFYEWQKRIRQTASEPREAPTIWPALLMPSAWLPMAPGMLRG